MTHLSLGDKAFSPLDLQAESTRGAIPDGNNIVSAELRPCLPNIVRKPEGKIVKPDAGPPSAALRRVPRCRSSYEDDDDKGGEGEENVEEPGRHVASHR